MSLECMLTSFLGFGEIQGINLMHGHKLWPIAVHHEAVTFYLDYILTTT